MIESSLAKEMKEDEILKPSARQKNEKMNFEQKFGANLFIWIASIALVLSGFFMVKYSIEIGLLSPGVRITLGLIFGVVLLYSAELIRKKEYFANGEKISQALSGAGVADLYICIFAANSLYHMVNEFIALAGIAAITVITVVLAIRHGMPIALIGLIGGFLAPAMISSKSLPVPITLFYLYFVFTGLMSSASKKCWWPVAILSVLATFLWIFWWSFSDNFIPGNTIWLNLFLIAISITVVIMSRQHGENNHEQISMLNYLTLGSVLLFTGVIVTRNEFGLIEWGFFFLLSLGGIGLAYFNQKLYNFMPWLSMAVNIRPLSKLVIGEKLV